MLFRLAFLTGCLVWALSSIAPCRAQFYAPDTEYHDRAQRRFVVELSRVLAWRQNRGAAGTKVAEVTFAVGTDAERQTTWRLRWLDADGRSLREDTVTYPESALTTGVAWYRDVAHQLLQAADNSSPAFTRQNLAESYWTGAEAAEPSRADSLSQAFALEPEKDPARLAGLLAQAALPSVGYRVSLDGVLLARAAAWLCVAEASAKEPDPAFDGVWTPILFLSGREAAAEALWKTSPAAASVPVAKWWGFLLSRPTSQQVFAAAADPQYRRRAMPLLVNEALLLDMGELLGPVLAHLFKDEKAPGAWHDYAPFIGHDISVAGGRLFEGRWPAFSREALVKCLRQLKPEETDFHGYKDALAKIGDAPATPPNENTDPSLAGWAAAAPLINLGYGEGTGKLTPVSAATARDLLNFAWESNGLQMGARWKFLALDLGLPEDADAIAKAVLGGVDGSESFFVEYPYNFLNERRPPAPWKFITRARLDNFARLQETGGPDGSWVVPRHVFDKDKGRNALLWIRRCWLLPDQLLNQSREMYFAHRWDDITPTLRRELREGGPRIDNAALNFYAIGLNPVGVKQVKGSDEVRVDLLKTQTETETSSIALQMMQLFDPLPPFESARRLEKVFWQRPGDDLPYGEIFSDYLRGHAYEAAKRFYTEAEPFLTDRVGFSDDMGPRRFTLAMLEGDGAAMREARRASASGSAPDMVMDIVAAVEDESYQRLGQLADDLHDRYPSDDPREDMGLKLKGFLPLVAALKNPADPEHSKALDYFGAYGLWPTLQWVLLQKAKLPVDDAVRFLGGRDANPERRLLVAYLLKDKELFTKTYDDLVASFKNDIYQRKDWSNMAFVVVHWLRNDLFAVPVPADQPDLKPSGVKSLLGAFAEKNK